MDTRSEIPYRGAADVAYSSRRSEELKVLDDLTAYFREYARERPETLALTCLAVGFVLGWKLKPW